jgi:hypothetical protein
LSEDAHIENGNKGRLLVNVKTTTRPEPGVVELDVRVDMERPTVAIVHAKDHSRVLWPSYAQVRYREALNCQERTAVIREIQMSDAEGRTIANPPDLQQMIATAKFTPIAPGSNEELLWRSGCLSGGPK